MMMPLSGGITQWPAPPPWGLVRVTRERLPCGAPVRDYRSSLTGSQLNSPITT